MSFTGFEMEKKNALIRDLTTGSVPKTLLTFSMPLFLSGLLQMVYNMVDMIVVGNFVGTQGLSAVSIGGEVLMLITFVAMGFSNAGQILISRYVGAKRHDLVGEMVGTLFTLLEGLAVIIMVIFLFTYKEIINWLNTPEDIWEYTRQYCITCVWGVVFIYGYNLVSAILRGMGDSKHPFIFIAIASVINHLYRNCLRHQRRPGHPVRRPPGHGSAGRRPGHGHRPGRQLPLCPAAAV